jgi:hypothetical protein
VEVDVDEEDDCNNEENSTVMVFVEDVPTEAPPGLVETKVLYGWIDVS